MDQKQRPNTPGMKLAPRQRHIQYEVGARGLIFLLLGILVLFLGVIGYLEYDRIVKPYMKIYICCIPALIVACLLFFLGFASKLTTIRQVQIRRPTQPSNDQFIDLTKPRDDHDHLHHEHIHSKTGDSAEVSYHDNGSMTRDVYRADGMRKYEPEQLSKDELDAQKRNLTQFLKDLDDQHKDGLLLDGVYFNLKNKYLTELNGLNMRVRQKGVKKAKKIKMKKK